ncbi:rhodanese-like domain-containing protein [Pediococcus claussenii]|uniref:Rhodanese domain-containing protein n=1 Tax=Pediococcus claussenii (strain ATCC BAA-344 / DSM 14800 / JCM 18046 / KCTC 3811 / LMG 21948 / P06) TaxID=701521 RepID=G8PED6_PEDCP|nr:rhodanese-like domain-containing protein [Pediococcus claussenii]AEV94397.1 hypothetical protein PECL_69 [Pediococcus claussenii ATCC BAA-344]ANZ69618.1 sulfurtransferase [Pediococcus claussenii]ANZ71435.1 sulfurtransferase [Pediococcus claussenii]KRN19899.1 hypothetical protein IV79_GL001188 [Pediococcus claussenii]
MDKKIEWLETYLSLYIGHDKVLEKMNDVDSPYVVLDVRNAPAAVKKDQIKGAIAMPAKDLPNRLNELSKDKIYVVYDWTSGTTLGKTALLTLLSAGFEAYELASALEGWKGMNLPIESII